MKMSRLSRILVLVASSLVLAALATPLWKIRLLAPQYPEGLGMDIHAGSIHGASEHDVQSINSLNHYIGMRTIEPEHIAELRVIPWLIVGLAAAGLLVAAVGRRKVAVAWLVSFGVLGVVGLWDFYHWEYEYGHDLDFKHAIIKVPGMTYQPPLIGTKQLLNFTASSWPTTGTLLIGAAFLIGCVSLAVASRSPTPEPAT